MSVKILELELTPNEKAYLHVVFKNYVNKEDTRWRDLSKIANSTEISRITERFVEWGIIVKKRKGVYIYQQKVDGKEMPQLQDLMKLTGWDKDRVIFALEYLVRKDFISGRVVKTIGTTKTAFVSINDVNPTGIETIENPDKFRKHFNHEIDLKIYKFSWGATETYS